MDKPLVSIVTLTYRKFESIFATIRSVLDQDYPSIEYIVSDDGSPDFPYEEIRNYITEYKKENIISFKILAAEKNRGTVRNINCAYREAAGNYILPLSAGDMFFSGDVVSRIIEEMEARKLELLVTTRAVTDENGDLQEYLPKRKNVAKILKLNTPELQHKAFLTNEFYDMASGSVLYIRKDVIEKAGYFDESYVLWEDGPFFTKYTRENLIAADYDIISIKYALGGVSNSGESPLMYDDYKKYNSSERIAGIDGFDRLTRMKLHYLKERDDVSGASDLLRLYLKYPLVMLSKILYKLDS